MKSSNKPGSCRPSPPGLNRDNPLTGASSHHEPCPLFAVGRKRQLWGPAGAALPMERRPDGSGGQNQQSRSWMDVCSS